MLVHFLYEMDFGFSIRSAYHIRNLFILSRQCLCIWVWFGALLMAIRQWVCRDQDEFGRCSFLCLTVKASNRAPLERTSARGFCKDKKHSFHASLPQFPCAYKLSLSNKFLLHICGDDSCTSSFLFANILKYCGWFLDGMPSSPPWNKLPVLCDTVPLYITLCLFIAGIYDIYTCLRFHSCD